MNYSDDYIKVKSNYENTKKRIEKDINALEKEVFNIDNEVARNIKKLAVLRKKNYLKDIINILNYLREPFEEDINYRKSIMNNFAKEVNDVVPDNLHLCFHGCPIYTAKEIIESKEISSSVDRIGIETSYDVSNQVSVTTKDTIFTTLDGYSDIHSLNYCIPCGVIFVINPNGDEEIESSERMLISNVNLQEEDRLYKIISTPENIDKLKEWCKSSNIDDLKVETFDLFLNNMKSHSK